MLDAPNGYPVDAQYGGGRPDRYVVGGVADVPGDVCAEVGGPKFGGRMGAVGVHEFAQVVGESLAGGVGVAAGEDSGEEYGPFHEGEPEGFGLVAEELFQDVDVFDGAGYEVHGSL